ncbi:MAG: exonuclease domain-containing protein [Clostridiaceae bacterium]
MKLLFFDTETTGLRPGSICQLSYIVVDTNVKPSTTTGKNIFFTVDFIEESAEKIHGFSVETLYELSGGMYFEDLLEDFLIDFQTADMLIGHNVNFDIKFLTYELEGCGEVFTPKHTFCTMNYYKNICNMKNSKNQIKSPKLQEAVDFLNISKSQIENKSKDLFEENGDFHDARFDTTATYLLVTEGIKKGYIPKGYFSDIIKSNK